MKKKICEIGAQIHYIKVQCDKLDDLMNDLVQELIEENPQEMKNIIIELIKEKDELL